MKTTFTKKIISLLLAVLILLSSMSVVAFAASSKNTYPIIYVHGFMSSDINADKDDPDSELYFPMQTNHIIDGVKEAVPALGALLVKGDWDAFGKGISPVLENIFYGLYNNPDGSTKGDSGTYFEYPTKQEIKNSDEIDFDYDWRRDPIDIAADLNDFIKYVMKVTGKKKVSLSCHSLGGVIVISYLSIYGNKNISGVAFDATAIYGESYTGDLLTGNIELSSESALFAIENMLKGEDAEVLVDSLLEIFEQAGLFQLVADLGNDLVTKLRSYLFESLASLFANWLTIWAMIPDEQIDEAMDFVFTEVYDKDDADAKKLLKKIKNYNKLVRKNKTKTLKALDKKAKVVVISRYGYASLAVTPSWDSLSDGTVDTKYNSFGATTAPFGTTFSEDYLKGKNMKYISPDKTVDASTCLFPTKTWFIRNMSHSWNCDGLDTMIHTLLNAKKEATVNTYKLYPRFMKYVVSEDVICPDDESVELRTLPQNFMESVVFFFKAFISFIAK
ncbi:MAG: hypothetical protein IJW86_08455 [Clostridia bacterium]|nr:hypothetical protein [Clostridia bacterium]